MEDELDRKYEGAFELTAVQGEDKGFYLKDFDNIEGIVDAFILDNSLFTTIQQPEDYDLCKEEMKRLNKLEKNIAESRLKFNDIYFGEFNRQCRELEKKIKEASDKHKASKNLFEKESMGKKSRAAIKLDIRTYDEKVAAQIEMFAKKLGATVSVTQ